MAAPDRAMSPLSLSVSMLSQAQRLAVTRRGPARIRHFSTTGSSGEQHRKESFASRLGNAWRRTPIRWQPIPIATGIAFLGAFQFYRIQERERRRKSDQAYARENEESGDGEEPERPRKRKRTRPSGPWTVQIMSTLPLKAMSRLWGRFNELEIPYYLRVPGFKLYGHIFGVNFNEIEEPDLHKFRNLAEFFYRTLKPGARPLHPNPDALLSPADGRIIQFGFIEHGEVEQVKGVTYSLDALLGSTPDPKRNATLAAKFSESGRPRIQEGGEESVRAEEEFALVNGISYTLPALISGGPDDASVRNPEGGKKVPDSSTDESTTPRTSSEAEVRASLATSPNAPQPWYYPSTQKKPTELYYCVVYLAPGDYHRFHSPVSWVVESRRHFAGELYSVSPYLQRTLPGLFTLNERVVLLGRWKYGFFSYTPVGATNVGSIVVNFDRELRTNSLLTDTRADLAAQRAADRGEPYAGYAEATYGAASPVLGGHALKRGEEMGGFQLGSTIVMVFEAPKGTRPSFDEGWTGSGGVAARKGGWRWNIEKGQRVKVGEMLGYAEQTD